MEVLNCVVLWRGCGLREFVVFVINSIPSSVAEFQDIYVLKSEPNQNKTRNLSTCRENQEKCSFACFDLI